ncbi:MAG: hypothetical protein JWM10_146, partial [Myxococcaceae bacterium]|nr:hypothetical protein [Myxococcaceae bacterium]
AGRPYRMTVDEGGRLLVLGTGALVRLSIPDVQAETIPLPAGWPVDAWNDDLPGNPAVLLAARRGAILLMFRSLWERGVDGVWRERFGCADPQPSTQCLEGRDAHAATIDDGGVWLLDRRYALWRRRDGDRTFVRVNASVHGEFDAIGVAPDGVLTLASRAALLRSRDGGHSFEGVALRREHASTVALAGVIATGEGLLLMFPGLLTNLSPIERLPPDAQVFEEAGGLRTAETSLAAWVRDGDVLYGGRGNALWRASIRALLRPRQEGDCEAE